MSWSRAQPSSEACTALADARRYLKEKRGTEFDPSCVDAFLARWDQVEAIAGPQNAPMTEKRAATS
jgi:putative two-component system response regulator